MLYCFDQPEGRTSVPGRLILASSSPRRRELLAAMGVEFEVVSPETDEDIRGTPGEMTRGLAQRKARAVSASHPSDTVLAADTLVCVAGAVLGKPADVADAARMLAMLSGVWHEVHTGVCVIAGGEEQLGHAVTRVRFSPMTAAEIAFYCASGEPMGKAGAYAIQGLGGMFIEEISGSYSNVVGLPTGLVYRMLCRAGAYHIDGNE